MCRQGKKYPPPKIVRIKWKYVWHAGAVSTQCLLLQLTEKGFFVFNLPTYSLKTWLGAHVSANELSIQAADKSLSRKTTEDMSKELYSILILFLGTVSLFFSWY